MSIEPTVLVAGGTGTAGRAYARAFRDAGYRVKATIRPGREPSELERTGVELVEVDLRDGGAVTQGLDGIDVVVVSVLGRGDDPAEDEARITRNVFDASRTNGVARVIYNSVYRADLPTGVPHFENKGQLEKELRDAGVPYTILRPATFMDALNAPWLRNAIEQQGTLVSPIAIETPISYIATKDLAEFAVMAVRDSRLNGATLNLGGPEALTYARVIPMISELLDKPVEYQQLPLNHVRASMGSDIAAMIEYFNRDGFRVDMKRILQDFPVSLTSVRSFLEQSGWADNQPGEGREG